jgi:superfamily II DNA or RNA helicase
MNVEIEAGTPPTSEEADPTEARRVLRALARGQTGRIPPELLVEHVLSVTVGGDWAVQRAALEAVLRRLAFAEADALCVATRPKAGGGLGAYRTRRRGGGVRAYATRLASLEPLSGSCDCPDFLRSSLGLCKHLLVVIDDVFGAPRRLARARAASAEPEGHRRTYLRWDPVRPLVGRGDWLERLTLVLVRGAPGRPARAMVEAQAWFAPSASGAGVLKATFADAPARRIELVRGLRRLAGAGEEPWGPEPAVAALLREEEERLSRETVTTRLSLRGLKRKLYAYQAEGVERLVRSGRLLLADDMGLGKTVEAIAACHALYASGCVERGLILVPASLKSQWRSEWTATSPVPIEVVDGGPAERAALYQRTRRGFLIANYEQALRDLEHMQRFRPDIGVLDEAQRIKNWATKTAKAVKLLRPPYRLVLTGTPMENRLEELASIMDWVDDHALEPKWRLVPWHSVYADGTREVIGARNLETLRSRLAPRMLRRVRQEVLDQLPARTDTRVPVELSDEQADEHDALSAPIAQLVSRAARRPLTQAEFLKLMRLLTLQRMIANGMAQVRFDTVWPEISHVKKPSERVLESLSSPKLAALRPIVAALAIDQGRKLVIFSQWRRMLTLAAWATADLLRAAGLRSAFFSGEESQARRTQNIVDLHDDPAMRVLFATDAGGVGLNLQRAATVCINLDLPWNPAVLEQRIGRIHRLGQSRPIDVYNLVTEGSIEARIASLVADKRALFVGLFDDGADTVTFERSGSFLAGVRRLLGPTPASAAATDVDDAEVGDDVAASADAVHDAEALSEPAAAKIATDAPNGEARAAEPDAPRPAAPRPEVPRSEASRPEAPASGAPPAAHSAPLPSAALLSLLVGSLRVERAPDGRVRIEAPAEAASALASLLSHLAASLAPAADESRSRDGA